MSKVLHEIFDIDDETVEETKVPAVIEQPLLVGGSVTPEDDAEDIKLQDDFNEAVNNIKDAIDMAKEAAEKIAAVAADTEEALAFNALNNLLSTIVKSSETTIALYSKKMEYKERKRKILAPSNIGGPGAQINIDKAVFTGTLDQLATALAPKEEGGD